MKVIRIIAVVMPAITLASCHSRKNKTQAALAPPVVEVVNPQYVIPAHTIAASGIITSSIQSDLSFKNAGMVEKVLITEGQYVQQGQLLAQMNTVELNSQLQQAEYRLGQYQRDIQRLEPLVKDTFATLEQLQNTHTAMATSQAQKEALQYVKEQFSLYAPASGIILKKLVSPGEYKQAGAVVFQLGSNEQAGRWLFKVSVSDKDRLMMQQNQEAAIVLDAMPGVVLKGKVYKLSLVPAAGTLTYDCYIAFDPGKTEVVYGLTGKLILKEQSRKLLPTLPLEALSALNDSTAIISTVAADLTVQQQQVHLLQITGSNAVLTDALPAGLQVITAGRNNTETGKKVTITHKSL